MQHSNTGVQLTRRNFLRGFGLLSASAALAACSQAGQTEGQGASGAAAASPLLAIIHTNDTHGHDVAVEGTDDVQGNFSMAAVAALKAEWEKKGYDVLLVDAGDATQGMPLVDISEGSSGIAFMNACGYDLMTVGNHEFDRGVEKLKSYREAAQFPIITANVLDKQSNERLFDANKVFELADGTKVGFFGLTTPSTSTTSAPKNVDTITFLAQQDLYACAQEQVDELRGQGCELVVCLGHLGNEKDSGGTSREVLEQVSGIDLFIDGHDHEEVQEEVAGSSLVETGCYLHNIGLVVIDEGAPAPELVAAGTYDGIDQAAQSVIEEENARVNEELGVVLGSTPFLLNGERDPGVRTEETNLGDFCTDSLRWTASQELGKDVDAAILNGGAIRATIKAGDIALLDIKATLPYANNVVVARVTGAQLLETIEASCQAIGEGNPIGAFPQVSGIAFTLDASVPFEAGPIYPDSTYASPAAPGSRVTITDVAGRGFSEQETYTVATTDFLYMGGDTYYVFRQASEAEQAVTFGFDYEAFVSYLVEGCDHTVPDDYAEPQGRITITGV